MFEKRKIKNVFIIYLIIIILLYKQQEQSAQAESGLARKGRGNKLMLYTRTVGILIELHTASRCIQ